MIGLMNQSDVMNAARGKKIKVMDSLWAFAVAFAFVGPFALPMFWRNPRFSRPTKIKVTIGLLVLTALLLWVGWASAKKTWHDIQQIQKTLNGIGSGEGLPNESP